MEGIIHIEDFLSNSAQIFNQLKAQVVWDQRMTARKTASYGVAYNYSQMSYPYQTMPLNLQQICTDLQQVIGFEPNNCLINYYIEGKSQMGFHSDQTDILELNTGIAIVSLRQTRILRFRNISNREQTKDFDLTTGSLFYMCQELQANWEHAIPKSKADGERMSLTFRKIEA